MKPDSESQIPTYALATVRVDRMRNIILEAEADISEREPILFSSSGDSC